MPDDGWGFESTPPPSSRDPRTRAAARVRGDSRRRSRPERPEFPSSPVPARSRPRKERRSRLPAVIVLVVVALILLLVGLQLRSSDSEGGGSGKTTPFSVLPLTPEHLSGEADGSEASIGDAPSSGADGASILRGEAATAIGPSAGGPASDGGDPATNGGDAGALTSTGTTTLVGNAPIPERHSSAAVLAAAATQSAVDVPVLMYHYVADVPPATGPYASGLTVRTRDFEDQMRYLRENGYHTVGLGDLYLARQGVKVLTEKPVILTFDDGGLDNYRVAFPIVAQNGLRATFFVIAGMVGKPQQMDWDDLRAMAAAGMSVESHTVSHPLDLRTVDDARLAKELRDSRVIIAREIGLAPESLSYPSGRYDQHVIDGAKAAGYLMAVTTNSGVDVGPDADYQMRRVRVAAFESIEDFSSALK